MVRGIERRFDSRERPEWPGFRWDAESISQRLGELRHPQGRLIGLVEGFGFQLRAEALLENLIEDVLKSSEVEGRS